MEEKREEKVYLNCKVNEIFATTEITQYLTNESDDSIELKILFPILKKLSLSKFVVTLDDKEIISKVMPKEKAAEKYTDSIALGNIGFLSKYEDNNKSYSVNIGNLGPKKQIKLKSTFIQMIDFRDLSYAFNFIDYYPAFHYEGLKNSKVENKTIDANIKIETQSKITRLIPIFLDEETKNNSTYTVKYSPDYKNAEIEYKNIKPEFRLIDNVDDENNLSILFRTEKMNKPILYYQYNPILKETAYSINYTYSSKNLKEIPIPEKPDENNSISYASKYEEKIVNETPGLFIFLVDQSNSMGSGDTMYLLKQALLLFIQSLPKLSYFQFIGFGTTFRKYNEEPVVYNKENVEKIIKVIKGLYAGFVGTNISQPLEEIYNDKCYSKINLSKNIFLLTDGEVEDTEKCIDLISSNSEKFRVHSIGIGHADKILIERCGKAGKGTSSFVKNMTNINSVVINALNNCLRPYITDIKFEFENYKEELDSKIIACHQINNFIYQNEIMNYSFILPGNKELSNLKIKVTGKDPINKIENENNISFDDIIKLKDGEEMSKMIASKVLKKNDELIKDEKKEIEFAKKYQILSKNTALFAEILNEENQKSKLIKVNLVNLVPYKSKDRDHLVYGCCMERSARYEKKYNEKSLNKGDSNSHVEMNIIISQDIIEGFWNENDKTKKLIDIITSDKFEKIKNKVIALNKGENEIKIIYTILVIYYMKTKCADNLDEYVLVINKANKFLEKNGIDYDDIVSDI